MTRSLLLSLFLLITGGVMPAFMPVAAVAASSGSAYTSDATKQKVLSYIEVVCRKYYNEQWPHSTYIENTLSVDEFLYDDDTETFDVTGTHSFSHKVMGVPNRHTNISFSAKVSVEKNGMIRVQFTREWTFGRLDRRVETMVRSVSPSASSDILVPAF